MIDVVSPSKRSEMMAGIKGRNTKPEILVRRALFASGYRFRLHRKDLPGSPDIVLASRKLAIFVNGCFWHGHLQCRFAKLPATRSDFWRSKLERTKCRDQEAIEALRLLGWRVLIVWECFIRQQGDPRNLQGVLARWIGSEQALGQLTAAELSDWSKQPK